MTGRVGLLLLLFLSFLGVSFSCNDIGGRWINKKGSILIVEKGHGHLIHGHYSTAVELTQGSAGNGAAHLRGFYSDGLLSFAVRWNSSTAVFAGQCFSSSKGDSLQMTWLLKSKVEDCDDHWTSNRVGEDRFVRLGEGQGGGDANVVRVDEI